MIFSSFDGLVYVYIVVVCLLAFASTIGILSVLIPTCYHRPNFNCYFVVWIVVNVIFLVVFLRGFGFKYCELGSVTC